MTVKKQDYILEALGQIDDKYIEEAVTYKKPALSFLHRKEWGVLAACLTTMVLATVAYQYVPIRNTETAENVEGHFEEDAIYSYGVVFVPVEQGATTEALATNKVEQDGQAENDLCGYPAVEEMKDQKQSSVNYSITSAKSRAEIINEATDAFRGTVTNKECYRTEGAIETVFTILTVEVEEVIKGETEQGKTYKIYIPVGEADGLATDNSLSGDLLLIEVGSKGTFIPERTTPQTGLGTTGTAEAWLSYADYADFYILNGVEHFVLESD